MWCYKFAAGGGKAEYSSELNFKHFENLRTTIFIAMSFKNIPEALQRPEGRNGNVLVSTLASCNKARRVDNQRLWLSSTEAHQNSFIHTARFAAGDLKMYLNSKEPKCLITIFIFED